MNFRRLLPEIRCLTTVCPTEYSHLRFPKTVKYPALVTEVPLRIEWVSIVEMTSTASRVLWAGLITGVADGLFSSVLSLAFYGSSVARLFQGVASVPLGRGALNGGTPAAAAGIAMHFGVALAWSFLFAVVALRIPWLQRLLASPFGVAKVAALYGPLVWMVMSLIVIPALTGRAPSITSRWWTQFFGHMIFVGLPIVAVSSQANKKRSRQL
jgi:hypothetical protein